MEFDRQYLYYNEFVQLGGSIDQMPFDLLEYDARKFVDERTSYRLEDLEEIPNEVKMCVNELINLQISINNGVDKSGNVINYKHEEITRIKYNIVLRYLSNLSINGTIVTCRGI